MLMCMPTNWWRGSFLARPGWWRIFSLFSLLVIFTVGFLWDLSKTKITVHERIQDSHHQHKESNMTQFEDLFQRLFNHNKSDNLCYISIHNDYNLRFVFPKKRECIQFEDDLKRQWLVFHNVLGVSEADSRNITLVTQVSWDRIHFLKLMLSYWKGPVSVAIYIGVQEFYTVMHHLYAEFLHRKNIGIHIVYKQGYYFPSNVLRNLAMGEVSTKYVFLLDGDFVPSKDTEVNLYNHLHMLRAKHALMVPAFAYPRMPSSFHALANKDNLVQEIKAEHNTIVTFEQYIYYAGHRRTNFKRWFHENKPYKVEYELYFEPYVLMQTLDVVRYPEVFLGHFYDKISFFFLLSIKMFTFTVLPDVYVIHLPHPKYNGPNYECPHVVWEPWVKMVEMHKGEHENI